MILISQYVEQISQGFIQNMSFDVSYIRSARLPSYNSSRSFMTNLKILIGIDIACSYTPVVDNIFTVKVTSISYSL